MTIAHDVVLGQMYTYSGKIITPLDPKPEEIDFEDIAHSLSLMPRFSGHTKFAYSVAQHSINVADCVSEPNKGWALMHDAPEAYFCDLPAPLKHHPDFALYRHYEAQFMEAVKERFGLEGDEPDEVKYYDLVVRATEMRDLTNIPEECYNNGDYRPLKRRIYPYSFNATKTIFTTYAEMFGII